MRARICSALSCDMFARVVYVRLWGVQNCRLLLCHLPARTRHAWLARLTRARGRRFLRGWKILLNDFCRAFGHSKARQTQSFFKYLHQKTHEIRKRISCVFYFTFSASHHDGIDENAQNRRISVSSPYECTAETDFGERKSEI